MANEKRSWKEIVDGSNHAMVFLPEKFKEEVAKLEEELSAFEKDSIELNKRSTEITHRWNDFWHRVRAEIAKEVGDEKVYKNDTSIGWNKQAKDEGELIINIITSQQ